MTNRSVGTTTHSDLPQTASDAYFAPALFQTLFWKPRFLVSSPVSAHLPLLFWLTAAIRPKRVAVLGCDDGAAHFALCQALEKEGLEGRCRGYGFWSDPRSGKLLTAPPRSLAAHEGMLYDSLSQIVAGLPLADALDRIGTDRADLLFVDHTALPADAHLAGETLMACLGGSGVLVLHGTNALQARDVDGRNLARFLRAAPHVEFDAEQGLIVIPRGDDMPLPLRSLIESSSGGVLRRDVEQVFRRSGQGLLALAQASGRAEAIQRHEKSLAAQKVELDEARAALADLGATLEARSQALAQAQATIFDLQAEAAQHHDTRAAVEASLSQARAEAEKARAKAEAAQAALTADHAQAIAALTAERDAARDATREAEAQRARLHDALTAARAEAEAARAEAEATLSQARAEAESLGAEQGRLQAELAAQAATTGLAWAEAEATRSAAQAAEITLTALRAQAETAAQTALAERQARLAEAADRARQADEARLALSLREGELARAQVETATLQRLAEAATRARDAAQAQVAGLSGDLQAAQTALQAERDTRFAETARLTRMLEDQRARAEATPPPAPPAPPPGIPPARLQAALDEAEALRQHGAELRREAEALRQHGAELRRDLGIMAARLDATLAERDALRDEIAALRDSTSWRVTAPMRRVKMGLSRKG
jgi:hypothetical protein